MLDFPCSRTFRDWDMERQGQPGPDYADELDCREKIWGEILLAWREHTELWWLGQGEPPEKARPKRIPKTFAHIDPVPAPGFRGYK